MLINEGKGKNKFRGDWFWDYFICFLEMKKIKEYARRVCVRLKIL